MVGKVSTEMSRMCLLSKIPRTVRQRWTVYDCERVSSDQHTDLTVVFKGGGFKKRYMYLVQVWQSIVRAKNCDFYLNRHRIAVQKASVKGLELKVRSLADAFANNLKLQKYLATVYLQVIVVNMSKFLCVEYLSHMNLNDFSILKTV